MLPDRDLNPDHLRPGEILYACGRWRNDQAPEAERVLVDIFFGTPDAFRPASREQERWVTGHGGRILYRHNLPAVRAEMPTAAIPDLVGHSTQPPVNHVRTVPDPQRHDVEVIVSYTRAVEEADIRKIQELGGRIRFVYTVIPGLSALLPDRSLPVLHALPEVRRISMNSVACLGV